MNEKFHLKIASREGTVFEGEVASLSSYNVKGRFDILPSHANFISLIKRGLTLRQGNSDNKPTEKGKEDREIGFDTALLRVKENNVEVYLGIEGMTQIK